jgi:histone acetyltransferase (RNA polymerase elongator complex component)
MKHYNIPIFVPHLGCPFDCVFCNQRHITSADDTIDGNEVRRIADEYLSTLPRHDRFIEIGFFGGSFTGIDPILREELLAAAYEYVKRGDVQGIRLSTRPDYIDKERLDMLEKYGVTAVELGVQSLDDGVLLAAGRGHTSEQVYDAVRLIKKYPFALGLQMMTGLPADTPEKSIETARRIIELDPRDVRIYPTLVIRDTYLETLWRDKKYSPQTLDEAVSLCSRLVPMFENAGINVIRVALAATEEISPDGAVAAGPFHQSFRELVDTEIYYDKINVLLSGEKNIVLRVNPKDISRAAGYRRKNIKRWNECGISVKITGDERLPRGQAETEVI